VTPQADATDVADCDFRPADFLTLCEALDYAATSLAGANFYSPGGERLEVLSYRDLRDQAKGLAQRLIRAGLAPGERVALVAETEANFLRAFFACQYAAIVPVPLPLPTAFAGRARYVDHIRSMLTTAKVVAVVSPASYLEMVREAAQPFDLKLVGSHKELDKLPDGDVGLPTIQQDSLSYLQFSSGSTRFPVGVAVTHRALLANLRCIARDALAMSESDRFTSWLPFYHDMGLVGFLLTPVATQVSVDYVATRDFARRPLIWPTLIARNRATISYSPSFGYELCARRATPSATEHFDLASWRVAGIGGDMTRIGACARFADAFRHCGFRKEAFLPSYGMAEASLAITFAPLNRGLETDCIDLDVLEAKGLAKPALAGRDVSRTRAFVVCGRVLPGHELEIRDANGLAVAERHVGRIMVRGPSLMQEYFGNPEATASALSADGWLDTGDLGYLLEGSLVVTGRSKDLILIYGRNIWPQDLEWAVERDVEGIRSGDVAAFSVDDGHEERVVLLVQCRNQDEGHRERLRQAVGEVVMATAGVTCHVALVPHKALPQTSSGKLSRARARQLYLASLRPEQGGGLAVETPGAIDWNPI